MVEPKIPRSCTKLKASLRSVNNTLAEADEAKLDTARIQKALDHCKPGMAVELRRAGGKNAFLTWAAGDAHGSDAAGGQGRDAVWVARRGGV